MTDVEHALQPRNKKHMRLLKLDYVLIHGSLGRPIGRPDDQQSREVEFLHDSNLVSPWPLVVVDKLDQVYGHSLDHTRQSSVVLG